MSHSFRIAAVLLACFAIQTTFAQRMGNSPFSQIGIGELVYPGYAPNVAMGGAGAAYANGFFINNVNPALLARNRSTTFDIGFRGGWKQIQTVQASQRDLNLNIGYLSMAFPASKRWTLGLNLAPFSAVNYDIVSRGMVNGSNDMAQTTYRGLGGLNAVSFNNGINVYKGLSIGLQTSYIFGAITKESISQLISDTLTTYHVASVRRTNYSDFIFKPGIAFRHKLNEKVFWNVGTTYDLSTNLQGNRLSTIQYRTLVDSDPIPGAVDTLPGNSSTSVRLPVGYQFGVSFDEPLRWAIAADVSYRNWAATQAGDANVALRNTMDFSLGGEWTPDVNSINNYFKRTTYRLGFNYAQMPISSEGTQLNDMSIRAGVFLPITPPDRRTLSYLNLAFSVGQRGTLNNSLVRERYVNLVLGLTINDFGWFIKPKID